MSKRRPAKRFIDVATLLLTLIPVAAVFSACAARSLKEPDAAPPFAYTFGTIVDNSISVPAGDFASFRIDVNREARVTAEFSTGSIKTSVECILLDGANFKAWKSSRDVPFIAKTGSVPGGKVTRVVRPGTYYFIVSSRSDAKAKGPKSVNLRLAVE